MTKKDEKKLNNLDNSVQQSMDDLYRQLTTLVTTPKEAEMVTMLDSKTIKLRYFKPSTWKRVVPQVMGKLMSANVVSANEDFTYTLNGKSDAENEVIVRVIREGLEKSYKDYTDSVAEYYKKSGKKKA